MMPQEQINDFIKNYRESLGQQYQTAVQNLDQQRKNDFRSIMSGANKMGMLYSNFPTRDKIIYDQKNYLPNYARAHQTYQTGLDKLRQNVVNYQNSIASIQEAISELNAA